MVKDKPVTYVPLVNGKADEPDQYLPAAGELWNDVRSDQFRGHQQTG